MPDAPSEAEASVEAVEKPGEVWLEKPVAGLPAWAWLAAALACIGLAAGAYAAWRRGRGSR